MTGRRRHLFKLAELFDQHGSLERARNEHLASLDADEGLLVLGIGDDEIRAVLEERRTRTPPRCRRCGARLPGNRHRCARCGLPGR
jgi:ribosomal protein L40E